MKVSKKLCVICAKRFPVGSVKFYAVPKNESRRQRWIDACGVTITENSHVCEKHFTQTDFCQSRHLRTLMPGAVPSLHALTPEIPNEDMVTIPELLPSFANKIDCGVQTGDIDCSYRHEIYLLKKEIQELKAENLKYMDENKKLNDALSSIFSKGQIRKLLNPSKKIYWTWDDVSRAICLHAAGPRAYRHLYANGFPLPHSSTLQAWARKIKVDEGTIHFSIDCLKSHSDYPVEDKICVISFDEMKVQEAYEHDPMTDSVKQPTKYVQMAIVRGLKASWKQPIYFGFDTKMTKRIITEIITALHDATFPVVAIVSDMGTTNQALWKELQVSRDKPWFQHPADDSEKVFVFADVPHLLKLIRNHFLDSGLVFDGKIISPQTVKQVMQYAKSSDVSIVHKLSDEHIAVRQAGKQKVKLAAQLFSNTTAAAIRRCYELGMDIYSPIETSDFIKLVNDWFDIHNSKMTTFNYSGKKPFGLELPYQMEILERIDTIMKRPLLPNKSYLAPFQKGILLSNNALRMLHKYVCERFEMSYVVSYRCNQDITENFFSAMRSKGGLYDHPTAMEFKYRLRKYMLAKNTEILSNAGNAEIDDTNWFNASVDVSFNDLPNSSNSATQDLGEAMSAPFPDENDVQQAENFEADIQNIVFEELHDDALQNLAGFIINKMDLEEYNDEFSSTWSYVDELSRGGLKKPTPQFLEQIHALEEVFYRVNHDKIANIQNFRATLVQMSSTVELPDFVKSYFFKCRMFFRIKHLNNRLREQKQKQKLIGSSKLLKIRL